LNDPMPPPSQLRPGVSHAVDAVLAKALAPLPRRRYSSASSFAIALGRALQRGEGEIKLPPVAEDVALAAAEVVLRPTAGIEEISSVVPLGRPAVTGRVRAAHLRVLSRILQHHVGETGLAKITTKWPELATAFTQTLAPLSWVDLRDLIHALEHTA